jgi:hypothetical protein
MSVPRKLLLVIPLATALLSGACAAASAKGKPTDKPALNVPPPPPRVIEPAPEPMPDPVSELPTVPATTTSPASRSNRSRESKPPANTDSKPAEQKPAEPPPADPAPVAQPPAQPPAQLRTPQTADSENASKAVRATVQNANSLLSNIDYRQLSKVRQKAYNDAKQFILQAEDAIKQGNFVFAQGWATKAEQLARELAGR